MAYWRRTCTLKKGGTCDAITGRIFGIGAVVLALNLNTIYLLCIRDNAFEYCICYRALVRTPSKTNDCLELDHGDRFIVDKYDCDVILRLGIGQWVILRLCMSWICPLWVCLLLSTDLDQNHLLLPPPMAYLNQRRCQVQFSATP